MGSSQRCLPARRFVSPIADHSVPGSLVRLPFLPFYHGQDLGLRGAQLQPLSDAAIFSAAAAAVSSLASRLRGTRMKRNGQTRRVTLMVFQGTLFLSGTQSWMGVTLAKMIRHYSVCLTIDEAFCIAAAAAVALSFSILFTPLSLEGREETTSWRSVNLVYR